MDPLDLIPFLDLTSLGTTDTRATIEKLCWWAKNPVRDRPDIHCAAVCCWPNFASTAADCLSESPVKLACVAAAFPCSQAKLEVKVKEVELAVADGATEIDIAIPRGLAFESNFDALDAEIRAIKQACGDAHLKVILETCDLVDPELIWQVCQTAMEAGADFLKSSTGMGTHGATLEHVSILFEAIANWYQATGKLVGVKPAGGIRTYEDAMRYYALAENYLPRVTPDKFRIGASSLLDHLLNYPA